MGKYKCKECGAVTTFVVTVSKFVNDKLTVFDGNNKQIKCSECGCAELSYVRDCVGYTTKINLFEMQSPERKKEILKKRAKEYSQQANQIEQRKNFNNNFEGKIDSSFY